MTSERQPLTSLSDRLARKVAPPEAEIAQPKRPQS